MKNFKLLKLKFVPILFSYLAIAMVFISCAEKSSEKSELTPSKEMLAHIINTETAVNIYQNYEKQRLVILKDTLSKLYGNDFNDTRRVWFNLKDLKSYIAYVEKKSAENKINPEGLQFYFSVYGDDEGEQKNHQTFFIAPTTKNEGVQSGYTLETRDGKTQALFLKSILKSKNYSSADSQQMDKASFFSLTAVAEEGLLYNRGGGSPPNGEQ